MLGIANRHAAARLGYYAGVEFDVPATRAALARLTAPVLLYAGDLDPLVTPAMTSEAARFFANPVTVTQAGAGHFPWIDDPAPFTAAVSSFLSAP
jgi:pimeloyl-ACP methyl ester carboxylesterase